MGSSCTPGPVELAPLDAGPMAEAVLSAAEAAQAGCSSGGGDDFEDVASEERRYGKSEDRGGGLMGEDAEPCGSRDQDENAGGCGGEQRGRESTVADAAAKVAGEGCGSGIGQEVSARWPEEVEEPSGTEGAKDGQSGHAFDEVEDHGGCGDAGREKESEEEDGEGLEGDRNRSETQRNRDVGADGDEQGAEDDFSGGAGEG